jgi:uncharacterized protein YjbI with pentapeptide repeats
MNYLKKEFSQRLYEYSIKLLIPISEQLHDHTNLCSDIIGIVTQYSRIKIGYHNINDDNFCIDLSGIDLSYMYHGETGLFYKANLSNANFSNCYLNGSTFHLCNLTNVNFSGSSMENCAITNSNMWNANLSDCKFNEHTMLPMSVVFNCNMSNTNFIAIKIAKLLGFILVGGLHYIYKFRNR